jgi:hypothetical protein
MKKFLYFIGISILTAAVVAGCQKQAEQVTPQVEAIQKAQDGCTTIQSGELVDSQGNTIETGFNDFGYNYQAHIYNGDYGYPGWHLVMKWNDAWLSNKDCDGDGLLDRPLDENGQQYYYGSGAWLTNHWTTTYIDAEGNECEYDEFIKIVAVPVDAYKENGYFYTAEGVEIGEVIWGQFAIIQFVLNDPCQGVEGVQYKSPDHPGLGNWD